MVAEQTRAQSAQAGVSWCSALKASRIDSRSRTSASTENTCSKLRSKRSRRSRSTRRTARPPRRTPARRRLSHILAGGDLSLHDRDGGLERNGDGRIRVRDLEQRAAALVAHFEPLVLGATQQGIAAACVGQVDSTRGIWRRIRRGRSDRRAHRRAAGGCCARLSSARESRRVAPRRQQENRERNQRRCQRRLGASTRARARIRRAQIADRLDRNRKARRRLAGAGEAPRSGTSACVGSALASAAAAHLAVLQLVRRFRRGPRRCLRWPGARRRRAGAASPPSWRRLSSSTGT